VSEPGEWIKHYEKNGVVFIAHGDHLWRNLLKLFMDILIIIYGGSAVTRKPLLLSKEVNTKMIYFTPVGRCICRQYCSPVPMTEMNHWDHAVLSSSDHKDSFTTVAGI